MAGTTDTIPAKLTPGEFVIKREAVDMIGVPFLNKLNNMPDEGGGHTEIDKLISMASMEDMKNMYGGGMVEMMGGGMVKNKMMGYGHGGMVKSPIMGMQKGGMAKNLKPIPNDNPGLGKLPEMVRNRMGYMQDGGMVYDSLMGMMKGGMAKKKKGYGYQDGGSVQDQLINLLNFANQSEAKEDSLRQVYSQPMKGFGDDGNLTRDAILSKFNLPQETTIDTLSGKGGNLIFNFLSPEGKKISSYTRAGNMTDKDQELILKLSALGDEKRTQESNLLSGFKENYPEASKALMSELGMGKYSDAVDKVKSGYLDMDQSQRGRYNFEKAMSRAGFQEGGMVGPPAPQQNEIMQPGQVLPGTVMGPSDVDMEQLRMMQAGQLQKSIQDSTVQKARDSLKLMGLLDSLRNNPQDIDILDNLDGMQGSPFLDDNTIYLQDQPSKGEMINKMMQMGYI